MVMNRKSKFVIAGLGVVALAAGGTFAAAQFGGGWRGHGMRRGGLDFHMGMFCGDGSRVDRMLTRFEEQVKPTEGQKASFDEFKAVAKTAADKVKSACPIEAARNVPEQFGMAEKRLEAALDAVRTIRPAADKLYASLSDEQKAAVNGMRVGRGRDRDRDGDGNRGRDRNRDRDRDSDRRDR
jgi:LTXXQ motif family protein